MRLSEKLKSAKKIKFYSSRNFIVQDKIKTYIDKYFLAT